MKRALALLALAGCPSGPVLNIPDEVAPATFALQRDLAFWPNVTPLGVSSALLPYGSLQNAAWSDAIKVVRSVSNGMSVAMLDGFMPRGAFNLQGGGDTTIATPLSVDATTVVWSDAGYQLSLEYTTAPYAWQLKAGALLLASGETGGPVTVDLAALREQLPSGGFPAQDSVVMTLGSENVGTESASVIDFVFDGPAGTRHLRDTRTPVNSTTAQMTTTELLANAQGPAGGALEEVTLVVRITRDLTGRADATLSGGDLGDRTVHTVECWNSAQNPIYRHDDGELGPMTGDEGACLFGAVP